MTQINLSLNGIPGTLWEIRRQECVHPYLGLRQAVLIINGKEKSLKEGRLNQKKMYLSIGKQKRMYSLMRFAMRFALIDPVRLAILESEIDIAEHNAKEFDQLILDAETELNIALQEKKRIENSYPDMANSSYQELQEKYAAAAFQCKLTRSLVVSIYAATKGLPDGASEIIYDSACLSPIERVQLDLNTVQQVHQLLRTPPPPTDNLHLLTPGIEA